MSALLYYVSPCTVNLHIYLLGASIASKFQHQLLHTQDDLRSVEYLLLRSNTSFNSRLVHKHM